MQLIEKDKYQISLTSEMLDRILTVDAQEKGVISDIQMLKVTSIDYDEDLDEVEVVMDLYQANLN